MKNYFITLSVFTYLAAGNSVFAAMPPYFKSQELRLSEQSEYFWTTANYDEFGDTQKLLGNNSYSNLTNKIDATYFSSENVALIGGLNFSYAKSVGTIDDRVNSEISDLYGRVMYKYATSVISIIPEAEVRIALNPIHANDDAVLTGEGANTYKVGTWALANLSVMRLRGYGYLGFEYRDEGRSALLPWTAGIGWRGRRWLPALEVTGHHSITDDEHIDNRFQREAVTSAVNGGSLRYYSVNPNLITARAEINYLFSRNLSINGGLSKTIKGESTADGQSVFIGFAYNFSPKESKLSDMYENKSSSKRSNQYKELIKNFEYNLEEDYDESLFEDEN